MTDIRDIIESIVDADDKSLQLMSWNRVADYYRSGADLKTLLPLLESDRARVVQCGAWLASEVVDFNLGRELFDALSRLLFHSDDEVRFLAIESVSLLVRQTDTTVLVRLVELLADQSGPVRGAALRWCSLIPDEALKGLKVSPLQTASSLLLKGVSHAELLAGVQSTNMTMRRLAIAGALRNCGEDTEFIELLYPFLDEEEKRLIPTLPRCRGY
jgi:hypothetical protein